MCSPNGHTPLTASHESSPAALDGPSGGGKLARADPIESRIGLEAGPAANNPGPRAVLRRHALRAARRRTLEANGIDCGAGPVSEPQARSFRRLPSCATSAPRRRQRPGTVRDPPPRRRSEPAGDRPARRCAHRPDPGRLESRFERFPRGRCSAGDDHSSRRTSRTPCYAGECRTFGGPPCQSRGRGRGLKPGLVLRSLSSIGHLRMP
jgi:hypothetical protein